MPTLALGMPPQTLTHELRLDRKAAYAHVGARNDAKNETGGKFLGEKSANRHPPFSREIRWFPPRIGLNLIAYPAGSGDEFVSWRITR